MATLSLYAPNTVCSNLRSSIHRIKRKGSVFRSPSRTRQQTGGYESYETTFHIRGVLSQSRSLRPELGIRSPCMDYKSARSPLKARAGGSYSSNHQSKSFRELANCLQGRHSHCLLRLGFFAYVSEPGKHEILICGDRLRLTFRCVFE